MKPRRTLRGGHVETRGHSLLSATTFIERIYSDPRGYSRRRATKCGLGVRMQISTPSIREMYFPWMALISLALAPHMPQCRRGSQELPAKRNFSERLES